MYVKIPAHKELGKAWVGIPLSALGNEKPGLGQLFQNLTNSDPLQKTALLPAAKNAHMAGTQVIDGVSTTHHPGSCTPLAAVVTLAANLRKELAPTLKSVQGNVPFDIWIDSKHQLRQVSETEDVDGQTISTTVMITAINQPVRATPPPPARHRSGEQPRAVSRG
jgi:hypothetical protein